MIEFLNNTFGIKSEVSVPILVSVLVFLTGGIVKLIFQSFNNFISRRQTRNSFRNIISEISKKCKQKSNQIDELYPKFVIEYNKNLAFKYSIIPYLGIVFQQDYNNVFNSFKLYILIKPFRNKKKIMFKAFNRIWLKFEDIKFIENRIIEDFNDFHAKMSKYETSFYDKLEELRAHKDKAIQPLRGLIISDVDFDKKTLNYIKDQDEIWFKWQQIDTSIRRHKKVLYDNIIKPLYDLNFKNQEQSFSLEQNKILLAIMHEYEQMTNVLSVYNHLFQNHFYNYKLTYLTLDKCLQILK